MRGALLIGLALLIAAGPQDRPIKKHTKGLSPEKAAAVAIVPDGFTVVPFAGEPDVNQPIALTLDSRGRLWVVEAHSYPRRREKGEGRDRILIFEDTDGDGKFDTRKIFIEKLNLVSGLAVGFGGVWVGAAPTLMFIPDKDGDDIPDGKPEILLDGWGYQDTHETLNSFTWGPDGWLYGCHGVFTHSRVGKPGTPDEKRVPINAGVWRYHPIEHRFEVFAWGTSNPWGIDFNDTGDAFLTACVIPHLWYIVQGGRYQRQAGSHFRPTVYNDIKTIADHLHYVGSQWNNDDRAKSELIGGGHAHCGALIYLGDNFPARYRDTLFTSNIHGNKLNHELLERKGSGFVGTHGRDFFVSRDRWFRGVSIQSGPDGAVYVTDWYDKQACHDINPARWDRTNGRIYKISYAGLKPWKSVDLNSMSDDELVQYQLHKNDWFVRKARTVLQHRGPKASVHRALVKILHENPDVTRKLRALWALHVTRGLTQKLALELLDHKSEHLRAWTIQLLCENRDPSAKALEKFATMAEEESSPRVRLYLASALQRIPVEKRWPIIEGLCSHKEDADDHNIPLVLWYGMEPAVVADKKRAGRLLAKVRIPTLRRYIARRLTE